MLGKNCIGWKLIFFYVCREIKLISGELRKYLFHQANKKSIQRKNNIFHLFYTVIYLCIEYVHIEYSQGADISEKKKRFYNKFAQAFKDCLITLSEASKKR